MSLKKQAIAGVFWSLSQRVGVQLITIIVSIILAQILLPDDFGVIALFTVFTAIGTAVINSGLIVSLVRDVDADERDYSTIFFFNVAMSLVVYLVLYLMAPLIADFFEKEILTPVIRVFSISVIFRAFSSVQTTVLTINMDFRKQMLLQIPAIVIGGAVAIWMANTGWGLWSLVYKELIQTFLITVFYTVSSRWKLLFVFDKVRFKKHFDFGYKLAISNVIDTVFANIYNLVIGKFYTPAILGFYDRANMMKQIPVNNLSEAVGVVTYPLFSKVQNDDQRLKNMYKRVMEVVIFILAPILTILIVLGEPLFRFILTDKWLPAVPYFQVLCIAGLLHPIHSYNLNILNVKGRTDLFLKLEIIKKSLIVLVVVVGLPFGIMGLVWGQVVFSVLALFINMHYAGKFIDFRTFEQFRCLMPSIFLSFGIGLMLYYFDLYFLTNQPDLLRIFVVGITGVLTYVAAAYVLKFSEFSFIKNIILKNDTSY